MSAVIEPVLLALQSFQVAILFTHDWVPMGRLNDIAAVRKQDSPTRLLMVTFVQSLPFAIGLACSAWFIGHGFPGWLLNWLWVSYGILFAGEIRAWWMPYLVTPEPDRADRYRLMFGETHSFLPTRNGIRPNTMHVMLHVATALTLIVLAFHR